MRTRLEGLGKRLLAYILIIVAVVILLRVVFSVFVGFIHTLILVALLVFALYALSYGLRLKNRS